MDIAPDAPPRVPRLPFGGKILLGVLAAYAVAVTLPDTLRPTFLHRAFYRLIGFEYSIDNSRPTPRGWYPLATLGFEANNDGIVNSVDACNEKQPCDSPAGIAKIQIGDRIDLKATPMSDRRAVNELVFVAHDRPVTIHIAMQRNGFVPTTLVLTPKSEDLGLFDPASFRDAWTLLLDQAAAVFFIGLCTLLVLRHPTREAWGVFLYAIWYNAGQYFVWYANLPAAALRWFDYLQAAFQAAGLTGLLLFALHFPQDSVEGWRRRAERWLFLPFLSLTVLGIWTFRNFTNAEQTEGVYRAYYSVAFAVYLAVFALFVNTLITQPRARPRIRWVIVGALWGLLCFLFADVYEATSLLDWLPFIIPDWVLNVLYAQSVFFPIAVFYAVRQHRVINVRFILNRSIASLGFFIGALFVFEYLQVLLTHEAVLGLTIVIAVVASFSHGALRRLVDIVFFPRWHGAQRDLGRAADLLTEGPASAQKLQELLVDLPVHRLDLTSGALFQRKPDGSFTRVYANVTWPEQLLPALPPGHPLISSLQNAPLRLSDGYWDPIRPSAFPMPVLAVPVVMEGVVSRIVLFGPHSSEEALDPDEVKIIHRLAKAAAIACTRLDARAQREAYERLLKER